MCFHTQHSMGQDVDNSKDDLLLLKRAESQGHRDQGNIKEQSGQICLHVSDRMTKQFFGQNLQ